MEMRGYNAAGLLLMFAAVFLPSMGVRTGQAPASRAQSPSSVVTAFIKMDLEGLRLEPEGWHRFSSFFVRSGPPRAAANIAVVSDRFELRENRISDTRAQVDLVFLHWYGDLEPSLRFRRAQDLAPGGVLIKDGISMRFELALVDHYSEFATNTQAPNEVKTEPSWRIEPFQAGVSLDLHAAIRYVTEMEKKASDPVIKKNADAALGILRTLK